MGLAFPNSLFPLQWRDHIIYPVHNTIDVVEEGNGDRLKVRLSLHCEKCYSIKTVRCRLPPECNDYNYRAAVAKYLVIRKLSHTCEGRVV